MRLITAEQNSVKIYPSVWSPSLSHAHSIFYPNFQVYPTSREAQHSPPPHPYNPYIQIQDLETRPRLDIRPTFTSIYKRIRIYVSFL